MYNKEKYKIENYNETERKEKKLQNTKYKKNEFKQKNPHQ